MKFDEEGMCLSVCCRYLYFAFYVGGFISKLILKSLR